MGGGEASGVNGAASAPCLLWGGEGVRVNCFSSLWVRSGESDLGAMGLNDLFLPECRALIKTCQWSRAGD